MDIKVLGIIKSQLLKPGYIQWVYGGRGRGQASFKITNKKNS
jgi:hypothetical protein